MDFFENEKSEKSNVRLSLTLCGRRRPISYTVCDIGFCSRKSTFLMHSAELRKNERQKVSNASTFYQVSRVLHNSQKPGRTSVKRAGITRTSVNDLQVAYSSWNNAKKSSFWHVFRSSRCQNKILGLENFRKSIFPKSSLNVPRMFLFITQPRKHVLGRHRNDFLVPQASCSP